MGLSFLVITDAAELDFVDDINSTVLDTVDTGRLLQSGEQPIQVQEDCSVVTASLSFFCRRLSNNSSKTDTAAVCNRLGPPWKS